MRQFKTNITALLAIASMGCLASTALAGGGVDHCNRCGGEAKCRKVCRAVPDVKEVEVVCYGRMCEDICVPGPCEKGCLHKEAACPECNIGKGGCAGPAHNCPEHHHPQGNVFAYRDSKVCCGDVVMGKKLMKKVIIKKVPTYKLVVEDLCGACDAKEKAQFTPPKPEVDARYYNPQAGAYGAYAAVPPTIILYAPNYAPGMQGGAHPEAGQPIQVPAVQIAPGQPVPAIQVPAMQIPPGQIRAVQVPAQFPAAPVQRTGYPNTNVR